MYHFPDSLLTVNSQGALDWQLLDLTLTVSLSISAIAIVGIVIWSNQRINSIKKQLRHKEIELNYLMLNVNGAVFRYILYPDGSDHVIYFNSVCEEIWEIPSKEVQNNQGILWNLVHHEDREKLKNSISESTNKLQPWFDEWRIVTPSGKTKWLQGRGYPRKQATGEIISTSLVFDITEQKKAQQALQDNQQTFKELTSTIPGAVYQYKVDHNNQEQLLFMSEGIRNLLNVSAEQVMANPKIIWEMIPPETRPRVQKSIEESAANLSPWEVEFEVNLPDGDTKWMKEKAIPKRVSDGVIWNGVKVDITKEKWQEQLLATQQEILEDLAEGKSLQTVITQLLRLIEQQTEGVISSVLLREGDYLWPCGESRLPSEYIEHTHKGIPMSEGVGSCGSAAYRGEQVITTDISSDPLWETIRELPLKYNLRACWSTPILSSTQEVLGTFALYTDVPRNPYPHEQELVNIATKLTGLAIERKQQEQALKQKAEQEQLLTRVTQQIRESLDLQTVLDRTVQEVQNFLKGDRVLIYSLWENPGKIIAEAVQEPWHSLAGEAVYDPCIMQFPNDARDCCQIIQQIPDIEQANLHACYRQMLRKYQVRANLVIPIIQENTRWGFLIVQQCDSPRQWQPGEIHLLQKLSEQVGIAIKQAELYQQAQNELQQREELAERLQYQARHDALTELPNRSSLMDRLNYLFQYYHQCNHSQKAGFALLFLDLNGFKAVNDTLGHEAGDELLINVAHRLKDCLRGTDTVGRLGGDEFIIILEGLTNENTAIEVAERIHQTLLPPTLINGQEVRISSSIGIVMDHSNYQYPEQMLRDADIAMYEAKQKELKYVVFHPDMQTNIAEVVQLESDLRYAIQRDELVLYYQPIFHLGTYDIQGFEVLLRWHHPQKGLIPPKTFIPIAEKAGLINEIELWTLQQACYQFKDWLSQFPQLDNTYIQINLSPKQFQIPNFAKQVKQVLEEVSLDGHFLTLELTEKVFLENQDCAIATLKEISQSGIKISLDQFGAGYSSLQCLHQCPISTIKVDQSLIWDINHTEVGKINEQILKAIVNLCHCFEINAIAAGVESQQQNQSLLYCGFYLAQGFSFCPPLSGLEMTNFLHQCK